MNNVIRRRIVGAVAALSALVLLASAADEPVLMAGGDSLTTARRTGDGTRQVLNLTAAGNAWEKTFYTSDSRLIPDDTMVGGVGTTVPEGMVLIGSDGGLQLYFDEATTAFAVQDTRSGHVWSSTPLDTELDKVAMGDNLKRLSALIMVDYYTTDGSLQTFDSYNHSVAFENFTVEKQSKGVTITYQIGKKRTVTSNDVPNIISKERLDFFLDKMEGSKGSDTKNRYRLYSLEKARTEEARQKMIEEYPTVVNGDIYVLKNKEDALLYMIRDNLEAAGYTTEDLQQDNAEHNIQTVVYVPEIFQVALSIYLENGELVAEVDGSKLKSPEKTPIHTIHVLPFFGAANLASRGYMLVPDGSGGLVYLNSFSSSNEGLVLPLYGRDAALRQAQGESASMANCLPVYGMKNGDAGFTAIIEQGDGVGNINCVIPGLQNSYNCIWPSFTINPRDSFEALNTGYLGGGVFTTLYPEKAYTGNLRVSYTFLENEKADYAGMAATYRQYLQQTGGLTTQKLGGESLPFILETIGAVDMPATLLGLIQYDKIVTLTTFEQTQKIWEQLREAGVDNIQLRLSGWMNGGMSQTSADTIRVLRELGGKAGLQQLAQAAKEQQIPVYADVQLQTIRKPGLFYSKKRNAVRYLGNVYAHLYRYDIPSGNILTGTQQYLLSPSRLPALAEKVGAELAALGLTGISAESLGSRLYSDYNVNQFSNRDDSVGHIQDALAALAGCGDILVDGGNAYALAHASVLVNMPVGGSGYRRINEEIPFYQMVLHGYLPYAGTPQNHTDDPQMYALRCVEYGVAPYYQWSYSASSATKPTYYNTMYALCYTDTFETAVAEYRRRNEQTGALAAQAITGHRQLSEQVYATRYENGQWVVVNYNSYDVVIRDTVVGAYDWAVVEGEVLS